MPRILLILLLTMTASAQAIVIRHDRDDNEYRRLAADYPMVCRVGPGMGTLIGSQWVITAAHVADALPRGAAIHFGERAVIVKHRFMIEACRVRGPISGFHQPSPEAVKIPDSRYPMRPVVFHLEDGMPGYFGIALDDSGKIDHLSVFVQDGICPKGKACTQMHTLKDLMPQGIE